MLFISIMMAFVWFNFSALRVECIFSPKKLSPFCSCFLFISFVRFSTGGSIYSFSVCPTTHSRPIITLYSFESFCHSLLLIVIFALYRFYPIRRDNRNFVLLRALESSLFICYFCCVVYSISILGYLRWCHRFVHSLLSPFSSSHQRKG